MSEDTSLSDKDNIDCLQVFAIHSVYRLAIGSALFVLTLSSTGFALVAETARANDVGSHPDRQ